MKKLIFPLILLVCMATSGCKKTPGCTDAMADNYSESAESDDGSCNYSGLAYFWAKNATYTADSTYMGQPTGMGGIKVWIDGIYKGKVIWAFDSNISDPADQPPTSGYSWRDRCMGYKSDASTSTTHTYHAERPTAPYHVWDGTFTVAPQEEIKVLLN